MLPPQTPVYGPQGYFSPHAHPTSDPMTFPQTPYGSTQQTDTAPTWGYPPQTAPPVDRNTTFPPPILPSIHNFGRIASGSSLGAPGPGQEAWNSESDTEVLPYRAWNTDTAYPPVDTTFTNPQVDPALRGPSNADGRGENAGWVQADNSPQNRYPQDGYPSAPPNTASLDHSMYASASYAQHPPQPPYYATPYSQNAQNASPLPTSATSSIPPLPRHTYTRTLVGPLSANACRLLDEHRKPGIFFLFQDLSVRTEGVCVSCN